MGQISPLFACVVLVLVGCSRPGPVEVVLATNEPEPVIPAEVESGPIFRVIATYPGASAKVVADTVAVPIEQQINGVEGAELLQSESRDDGTYSFTIRFTPKTDVNAALVLVQHRVNIAQPQLPEVVRRQGVTVDKTDPDRFPLLWVAITSPKGAVSEVVVAKIAERVKNAMARVPGIAEVRVSGPTGSALRVWLDPKRLEARALTAADVAAALASKHSVRIAPRLGPHELPSLLVTGENDATKLRNAVVKQLPGAKTYLNDVATVEVGVRSSSLARFGDQRAALVAVVPPDHKARDAAMAAAKNELGNYEGLICEVLADVTDGQWSLIEIGLPDGITRARLEKHTSDVVKLIRAQPGSPIVFAFADERNVLRIVAKIAPKDTAHIRTLMAGYADTRTRVSDLATGRAFPVRIALTDEGGHGPDKLREWADAVARRSNQDGVAVDADVDPGAGSPTYVVQIDREKAATLGVTALDIANTLHKEFEESNDINRFGETLWTVDLAASLDAKSRTPDNLKKLEVTSKSGEKVLLGSVVEFRTVQAPPAVLRVNLHPALRITAAAPEGKNIAEVAAKCVEIAEAERKSLKLPDTFRVVNLTLANPK